MYSNVYKNELLLLLKSRKVNYDSTIKVCIHTYIINKIFLVLQNVFKPQTNIIKLTNNNITKEQTAGISTPMSVLLETPISVCLLASVSLDVINLLFSYIFPYQSFIRTIVLVQVCNLHNIFHTTIIVGTVYCSDVCCRPV